LAASQNSVASQKEKENIEGNVHQIKGRKEKENSSFLCKGTSNYYFIIPQKNQNLAF
jgi:hypothetical protein